MVFLSWLSLASSAGRTLSRFSNVSKRRNDSFADNRMARETMSCNSVELKVPRSGSWISFGETSQTGITHIMQVQAACPSMEQQRTRKRLVEAVQALEEPEAG